MAKLTSPFVVKGKFAGGTAYSTKDGNILRTNGTLDKTRIMNDPNFSSLRDNMSEFGVSASSGKAVRNSLKSCAKDFNGSSTFLMTKYMRELCNKSTLEKGLRIPLNADYDAKKVSLFKRKIAEVCRKNVLTDITNSAVTVALSPTASDLIVPPIRQSAGSVLVYRVGATVGMFDLASLKSEEISGTTSAYAPVTAPVAYTDTIDISAVASAGDFVQVAVFIEFAEELNGFTYPIGGGRYYVVEGQLV